MIERNHHGKFKLYCVTEDKTAIRDEVEIIDLPDFGLEKWWNKLWLFSDEFPVKRGVFLDLDLILQHDINFLYQPAERMKFLYTDWIDLEQLHIWTMGDNYKFCSINSSVLCWDENTKKNHIWEYFLKNRDKILFLFKGIDNYIENMFKDEYLFYDEGVAYSYWNCDRKYREEVPVILFDYDERKQDVLKHHWVKRLWK